MKGVHDLCRSLSVIFKGLAPAFTSLTQPGRNGGLGLRLRRSIAPAAIWASAAIVAPDLVDLASRVLKLPFVVDRETCHVLWRTAGVRISDRPDQIEVGEPGSSCPLYTLPSDPANIATHYQGEPRIRCLQRSLTRQIEDSALKCFLSSLDCSQEDRTRLKCCSRAKGQPVTNAWLSAAAGSSLEDCHARVAIRLRLGLAPIPSLVLRNCPLCREDDIDPWHALTCIHTVSRSVTTRHDNVANLLIAFLNANFCVARAVKKAEDSKLPDVEAHLVRETVYLDVSGTHIFAKSYRENTFLDHMSGLVSRADLKTDKYAAWARDRGARFAPFVLDSFGRLHCEAANFITLIANECARFAPSPARKCVQSFIAELSTIWQRGNGEIVSEWAVLCRAVLLSSRPISSSS